MSTAAATYACSMLPSDDISTCFMSGIFVQCQFQLASPECPVCLQYPIYPIASARTSLAGTRDCRLCIGGLIGETLEQEGGQEWAEGNGGTASMT